MAIDPKKLKSYLSPEGDTPKEMPPAPIPMKDTAAEIPGGTDFQEYGPGRFGDLIPKLEEHAEEIEACCDELPLESLLVPEEELSSEDEMIFYEGIDALPEDLLEVMATALPGLEPEDAMRIAEHLEAESRITDAMRTAGYLIRVAAVIEEHAPAPGGDDEFDDFGDDEDLGDADYGTAEISDEEVVM